MPLRQTGGVKIGDFKATKNASINPPAPKTLIKTMSLIKPKIRKHGHGTDNDGGAKEPRFLPS